MITNMYAIRDNQVGTYNNPFCQQNDVLATRGFRTAVNDNTIQLVMYPEVFDLYQIARYDTESGKISAIEPKFISSGVSLKNLQEEK